MAAANLTELVVRHLRDADFSRLPADTVERTRVRIMDAIGQIAAGTRAQSSRELVDLVSSWGGRPDATLLTTDVRVPAMHAALTNAVLMRSYDFEPVGADRADGVQIPSHITGTTVAVGLAVAEARGASGQDLITAIAYGDDLAARVGHATGFDVYGGGDNTGTINAIGGVATAGILMGLDERAFRDAFGLVINQLGGTIDNIFDKTVAFKLPIGLSARNAVFSAELAAAGFSGPADAIAGRFGFLAMEGGGVDANLSAVTDGLGERFFADAVIKPWPTCRASQASLDATLRLVEAFNVTAADVDRVRVHVTPKTKAGFVGQPFTIGSSPQVSGAFSIHFAVATALVAGTVGLEHMGESFMTDPRLADMLARVEIDASLPPDEVRTAEVEVWLTDGTRHHMRVEEVLGDLHFAPLGAERIEAKFRSSVAWGGLADTTADELLQLVAGLEHAPDLARLSGLLAA